LVCFIDDGYAAFNQAVTLTLREKAIAEMEGRGVEITPEEAKEALAVLPKVFVFPNLCRDLIVP
jgi:hypothetical protein